MSRPLTQPLNTRAGLKGGGCVPYNSMKKEKLELIITAILIILFIILFMSLFFKKKHAPSPVAAVKQEVPKTEISIQQPGKQAEENEAQVWGRDPFTLTAEKTIQVKSATLPILTGIIWDEQHPMAVIGDEVVGIGGKVSDYEVKKIEKERVILQKGEETFTLELYNE